MSRVKVLPLEWWMKCYHKERFIHSRPRCKEITPVFNRDGYYYKTINRENDCWFEVEGRAYKYSDADTFRYKLMVYSHRPLPSRVVEAYTTVIESGYCEKGLVVKLRNKLRTDEDWKEVANFRRLTAIGRLTIRRKQNES